MVFFKKWLQTIHDPVSISMEEHLQLVQLADLHDLHITKYTFSQI